MDTQDRPYIRCDKFNTIESAADKLFQLISLTWHLTIQHGNMDLFIPNFFLHQLQDARYRAVIRALAIQKLAPPIFDRNNKLSVQCYTRKMNCVTGESIFMKII